MPLLRQKLSPAVLSILLVLLLGAPDLGAQSVILVRVTASGQPVGAASVSVLFQDQALWGALTTADGRARVAGMPGGTYEVRVEAPGYHAHVEEGVRVEPGQTRVLEVALELAPIELEGLRAVADRIQIQRQNTDFSTTVDQVAMELLPVSRDASQIVGLTPGARPGHVWGGASVQANSYLLDGLSINHPGMGGDLVKPNVNWIDRVEVRGLGAGAEYGGFQGGLVNIVTRSGSNDFGGTIRTAHEADALNASNLAASETGSEIATRYDVEGQVHGPLVTDRLFYFLAGQRIESTSRALNHVYLMDSRYSPLREEWTEHKLFGKLTWTPGFGSLVELSGGYLDLEAGNYDISGYEAAGASHHYTAPTWFGGIRWHADFSGLFSFEAKLNHFGRDERTEAYGGTEMPGIRTFALNPPYTSFGNAPFTLRSAPSSTSGSIVGTIRLPAGDHEHLLRIGAEYTRGDFLDRRIRNGGMTWMPPRRMAFDATDPGTWSSSTTDFLPTEWGGQVHLDADVANTAAFAQASIALGSRVVLSPGLRWGRWQGWVDPRSGGRFLAVEDDGWDPRLGLSVDLDADGSLLAKAHWGRYHQNMIAQMFDRAAGGDVFSNQEIWYYRGSPLSDPATRFTEAERDALAEQGLFTHESTVVLNETGPVADYNQPYIDQWLVGLEKQFGSAVKLEALYTRRTNHDMIALVDRNRATNYSLYRNVRVYEYAGKALPFEGGTVVMKELYVPNYMIRDLLAYCDVNADRCPPGSGRPPFGFEVGDTATLSWDPDYVLTNAPDARREFGQYQFSVEVARPTWGGSVSVVFTDLRGDLDNVSGYADPTQYSAGPYVRVNEGVNAYGILPNFSEREAKLSVWGMLPWELRGGLVWNFSSGDHFSPRFRISAMGLYEYKANAGVYIDQETDYRRPPGEAPSEGDPLWHGMLAPLEGHYVFIGGRGNPQLDTRANFDVRLDRMFDVGGLDLGVSLELFNVFGRETETAVNPLVNQGRNYAYPPDTSYRIPGIAIPPDQYYRAVLDRVQPRRLQLGMFAHF